MSEEYGPKCDIWSAGVLYYLLLCGTLPFHAKMPDAIAEKTIKEEPKYDHKAFTNYPKAKEFIQKALKKDKNERIDIDEAVELCNELMRSESED